jgi:hypothetical protein
VQASCCDEGGINCVDASDVPLSCPVGCSIVFPEFMVTCTDHIQDHPDINLVDFQNFEQECLDQDSMVWRTSFPPSCSYGGLTGLSIS